MRIVAGSILIALGLLWAIMCFVGTAMMSRSVDMFTEAVLPGMIGLGILAGAGTWVIMREPKRPAE